MALLPFESGLAGKKVFVTGHTGFTGAWACLWLRRIGARVTGFALPPPTEPSLFDAAGVGADVETIQGDIRDLAALRAALERTGPDVVLHLAAQALVRKSYREPLATFAVNAMGTANVLEAVRQIRGVRGVLCVTTDKVYENRGDCRPRGEDDRLGGADPYSASKAAAEMIIQGYAHSFPLGGDGPALATARGGNIVGGGDWAEDRLIPDFVRAVVEKTPLRLRYPEATRPWQHVLALVQGYLMLMAGLLSDKPETAARAWNLGPADARAFTVREVLESLCRHWRRPEIEYAENGGLPECAALSLDSSLARERLGWRPPWDTETTVRETAGWYRDYYAEPAQARALTLRQIEQWREGVGA